MHRTLLLFALLLFPLVAGAEDPATLKAWVKAHPIEKAFPLEGELRALSDEEEEMWMSCLNSGRFPSEVAYLADVLTVTGIRGDGERHRALTKAMADVISLNNFSKGTHETLSSMYPFVRTWLIIRVDPSLQQGPSAWAGMMQELEGLKLPPDAVAKVMMEVLDRLDDSNWNKGLTALQMLRFYLEVGGLEHKELQARLFHHNWEIPVWSPQVVGSPKEIGAELNALLKDRPGRVSWATLLFTWAWGSGGPAADPAENAKWAKEFQRVTKGSWLEGLAGAYRLHCHEARQVVVYSLFESAARAEFHRLPLPLQHQVASDIALRYWLRDYPDQADAVLTCCVETMARTIRAVTNAPSDERYLKRYATSGDIGGAIARRYEDHAESCRALVKVMQVAYDEVFAQDLGEREDEIRNGLEYISSLLDQFAFLEERAKRAGK